MKNNKKDYNFIIRFLWFCSGANIEVLKRAKADQDRYAHIGFAIVLIIIFGGISGGYALWTVFDDILIARLGGSLFGVTLGSIDRFVIASINKRESTGLWEGLRDKIGGFIFFLLRLSISIVISFVVAKPLEIKLFEASIKEEISEINNSKIDNKQKEIDTQFSNDTEFLKEEKQGYVQELKNISQQIDETTKIYVDEVNRGREGRPRGEGDVALSFKSQLDNEKARLIERENILNPKINEINNRIENLEQKKDEELEKFENNLQAITADDFIAQLTILHDLQKKEDPIVMNMGIKSIAGWAITLVFILIDTTAIIIKLFAPKSVYDELLHKNQVEQSKVYSKILVKDYNQYFARLEDQKDLQNIELHLYNDLTLKVIEHLQTLINEYDRLCKQILTDKIKIDPNNESISFEDFNQIQDNFKKSYLNLVNIIKLISKDQLFSSPIDDQDDDYNTIDVAPNVSSVEEGNREKSPTQSVGSKTNRLFNWISNTIPIFTSKEKLDPEEAQKKTKKRKLIWNLGLVFGAIILLPFSYANYENRAISKLKLIPMPYPEGVSPNLVYTDDGEIIKDPYKWQNSLEELDLKDFSPYLVDALIASEDKRFYEHKGYDKKGLARAIVKTLQGKTEGGSTITMQLANKLFIEKSSTKNKYRKKIQQILLASRLEKQYSKDEILEVYLNRIYLSSQKGVQLLGFEKAAQFYFSKSAKDINLSESTTLVKMLPFPDQYNPIKDKQIAKDNRDLGIQQMLEQEKVTQEEANNALNSDIILKIREKQYQTTLAPHFYIKAYTDFESIQKNILGLDKSDSGQYIIETTLNTNYQNQAELTLENYIQNEASVYNLNLGVLVTLDNNTGEILSYVSYPNFSEKQFDYVRMAEVPLASTFKLFTYTAAIANGILPSDLFSCEPWQEKLEIDQETCNDSKEITVENALAYSKNNPTLHIADQVGFDKIENLADKANIGIDFDKQKNNSETNIDYAKKLVLGTVTSSPLKITNAYAAIANQGKLNTPYTIKTIRDRNNCQDKNKINTCKIIYSWDNNSEIKEPEEKEIVSASTAKTTIEMLRKVVTDGTASGKMKAMGNEFISDINTVGKTGTSKDHKNLWFIGTVTEEEMTTGVWIGQCINDPKLSNSCKKDEENEKSIDSRLAVGLWIQYMKKILIFE
ncbi:MAG: DUF4407 domain-containing protein [Cyanobacteria bacterium P01_G01_bin.39]